MAKKKTPYSRLPWCDRFNQPTAKQLRSGLPARVRPVFDRARRRLLELDDDLRESFAWYGETWKWTIEIHTKKCRHEPLAIIIPSPEDLQLAVPLDPEFANSISIKRMKRAIRDGLELAREPFDTRWGIWSLQNVGLVEDLQHLVESKLRHLSKAAG